MIETAVLLAVAAAAESYPGNMALEFKSRNQDVVRVPHESSMNGPLIDSWTVELWVRASEKQLQPRTGRHVNLVSFPGRHPSVTMSIEGYATTSLRTSNGTWYSYEGSTHINDGKVSHAACPKGISRCMPCDGARQWHWTGRAAHLIT